MSRQIRGHSRDSRPAVDNRGLATSRPKAMLPPNTSAQAAALRSVLSNMSDDELLQYKAAFQNYDADEDGYLDLPQAMKALHSCGVAVSSNAMLDSLDDLEEAQEGDMHTSEWEQEQGRRRRRRRRHSLESMEERAGNEARQSPELQVVVEQTPAASPSAAAGAAQHDSALPSPDPNEQKQASSTDPSPRMRVMRGGPATRHVAPSAGVELDRANSSSSLRSPSIDISTFLNLLQRRTQEQQQAAQPHYVSSHHHRNNSGVGSAATTPAAGATAAFPRSATNVQASSRLPLSSSQAALPTSETWPRAQPLSLGSTPTAAAASAAAAPAATGRPFIPVSASSPAVSSLVSGSAAGANSATNSPRLFPTLRLRDHSASENRLQILGLGHSIASRLGAEITGHGPVPPIDSVRGDPRLAASGVGGGGNAVTGLGLSRAALQAAANDDDDDADFDPEQDLLAAFHTFDPTHSGTMSIPHLMAVMTHMGEKWSEEEAGEMAEEIDTNHDGRFNYRQLVKKLVARE